MLNNLNQILFHLLFFDPVLLMLTNPLLYSYSLRKYVEFELAFAASRARSQQASQARAFQHRQFAHAEKCEQQ